MNFIRNNFVWLSGLTLFIIYLITLAPSVVQIDAGELAAVQATLGIAHPTGYPLFTLIGYLFSKLPLPFSTILQLNILASIWCASAVVIFILAIKNIKTTEIQNLSSKREKKSRKKTIPQKENFNPPIPEIIKTTALIFAGFVVGLNKTFWAQSTSVEVYSLHAFLICLTLLFAIKAYQSGYSENFFSIKNPWLLLSIALALGFANHMTTLLILPGIAYLYFSKFRFNKPAFTNLLLMITSFIGLLIIFYLYLPLRAAQQPSINWGNATDLDKILRHISGKQYQVWIFSSIEASKKQLAYFINNFPSEFTFILIPAVIGFFSSFNYSKKISVFFLICFISTVLYSINYDISDIDSYFLLAYISVGYFSFWGVIKIFNLINVESQKIKITLALSALILILHFGFTYGKVNQSGNYVYQDYTKALINSVPKNSIILSYQWDYFVSASYYFQNVEGFRNDVVIVDKELLRRSWYFNQIETNHPFLLKGVASEVQLFKEALIPFESDEPFNSNLLESLYQRIIIGILTTNIDSHDVFIAPELVDNEMQQGQLKLPQGYFLVPDLFLYRVVKESKYIRASEPNFKIRMPEEKDKYVLNIQSFVASMLSRRALYELQNGYPDRAKVYAEKIVSDFPDYGLPPGLADILK